MPLHLLGKKSWNVYNADNIARVQRDEAAAAAEEHAAEQRMQDADAARRLAILRGETPPPLPEEEQPADPSDKKYLRRERDRNGAWVGGPRKRKRAGEDDTDFEMRVASERAEEGERVKMELGVGGQKERVDVDIVDSRGHIDLVGAPPKESGEQEGQKGKARGAADRNALGALKGDFADDPWYADSKRRRIASTVSSTALVPSAATTTKDRDAERGMEAPTTNVWGRDDPKRRGRETARLDANDPLAAMKSGAKKVRDIAKERRRDAEERGRELEELRREERRREKRRKRDRSDEDRDGGEKETESRRHPHRSEPFERRQHGDERRESRHDHAHRGDTRRHREREHSREREKDRHHRRDRDRSRERDRSSRSHRYDDRDDRHGHREKDDRRRHREV